MFSPPGGLSFSFGFPKVSDSVPVPAFNSSSTASLFGCPPLDVPPHEFIFGASGIPMNTNPSNSNASDIQMDSS